MQLRKRSRLNESQDHPSSAPRLIASNAGRTDVIPIQQGACGPIFIDGDPGATGAVTRTDDPSTVEFMDLRGQPRTPRDFLVTIHRYAVRAVTGDDSQSAHKPTAASW